MKKYYTGVGSRKTPLYILYMMSELAVIFESKGYILRSGCATGADAAFEDSLINPSISSEIYIPNRTFPFSMGTVYKNHYIIPKDLLPSGVDSPYYQANRLIHKHDIHRLWKYLKGGVMDLHNRNIFQVLGLDLKTKSSFNICYTRGKELKYSDTSSSTGGTGTSINASDIFNIELFNLSVDEHYTRLRKFIDLNKKVINYENLNNIKPRSIHNKMTSNNKFVHDYNYFMDSIISERNDRETEIKNKVKNGNKKNDNIKGRLTLNNN